MTVEAKLEQPVETPVPQELKATPEEAPAELKEASRADIEKKVIEKNAEVPKVEVEEEPEAKPAEPKKPEEPKDEPQDPAERMKRSIQKRIDKEVAKRKTLEEQLAEKDAELARLKTSPEKPKDEKREPTDADIRAALKKAREDGDMDFEAQILEYMVQKKANAIADERIRSIEERNTNAAKAQKEQATKWVSLNQDFLVYNEDGKPDYKHPMSLTNQEGLLYTHAMQLYKDPELRQSVYNDPDVFMGFRRAVTDAYRELYDKGIYKPLSKTQGKTDGVAPKRTEVLAEPTSESSDEPSSTASAPMSDADKVREEIKRRNAFLRKREPAY